MPRAIHDGIEIEYETFGDPADPALLLISGLGGQMVSFDSDLCDGFVDRGFFVIRFDNRDVGLSTKIESDIDAMEAITEAFGGNKVDPPYLLSDMADDAVSVLDDFDIENAHIVGVSMGGMIAQTVAIEHPERVLSLTSIMSTTGDGDVGQPSPDVLPVLLKTPPAERDANIHYNVEVMRTIGSPEMFEEDRARKRAELQFDRCYYPRGVGNQLLAVLGSGSRTERLRSVHVNALVIHGDADPLVNVSGGERTAKVIQGAELLIIPGMGHDLPSPVWPQVIEAITALAARSN